MPRTLVAALLALAIGACGGSSASQGATVAGVAVQQGDLPSGMTRCDLTGDIATFIKNEQSPDPATAQSMKTEWEDAKTKGAKAGYAAIYTDSSSHCAAIKASGSDIGGATYKLV